MHFSNVLLALSSLGALGTAALAQPDSNFLVLDGPAGGYTHLPDRDHRRIRSTRTTLQTSIVKRTSIPVPEITALPDITEVTHGLVGKIERDMNCDSCGKHPLYSAKPKTLSTRLVTRGVECDECGKHSSSATKSLITRGADGADCSICGPKCTMTAVSTPTMTPTLEARSYSIPTALAPSGPGKSVGQMVSGFGKRQVATVTVTAPGSVETGTPREPEREQEESNEYEEEEMGDD